MLKIKFLRKTLTFFSNSKTQKKIITYVLISVTTMSVVLLPNLSAGAPIGNGQNPQYISCSGQPSEPYSGQITDQEGIGAGPEVLYFFSPQPYIGGSQKYVTTDKSGYWSTSLISCYYDAKVWWNSSSDGPYLTEETGVIQTGSVYKVSVWETSAVINVSYQYPGDTNHTLNATSSWSFDTSWYLSINAKVSGGINDGFLSVNYAGDVGTTITISSDSGFSGSKPYVIYYPTGTVYTIEAANGSAMAYFVPFTYTSGFSSMDISDYMTMDQAWKEANNSSYNPFVEVSSTGIKWWNTTFANTTSVDTNVTVKASVPLLGSISFTTEVSVGSGKSQQFGYKLTNPNTTENLCFIVYDGGINYIGGPDVHVWQYGLVPATAYCPI